MSQANSIRNPHSIRHGLTCGSLPKGAGYVKRITNELRTAIERAVVDARGEITLHDAAVIQTAVRWERHALLAQRWLRREDVKLTADQRLAFSRDIARASAERDKCLAALKLDERSDPYASLYGPRPGDYVAPALPGESITAPTVEPPGDSITPSGDGALGDDSGRPSDSTGAEITQPERSCASDSEPIARGTDQ